DRVALRVVDNGEMTFGQWDRWSNAVARSLVAAGVERGDRVALLLPNDAALRYQVGYIAVQKAGAVAVPINPRYARREVDHILGNSGAALVMTTDSPWEEWLSGDHADLQVPLVPSDPADILYTSGTTGLPKGVAGTHENWTAWPY